MNHVTGITAQTRAGASTPGPAHDRIVAAFARAASTIACEGSLQTVLDRLAEEVLSASNATACALLLISRFEDSVELFGSAGYPDGFLEQINESMALRTPLVSLEAYRSRARVSRDMAGMLGSDPRFAPYTEMARSAGWTSIVSIPLVVREEQVGAMTVIYGDEREPDESEISFLTAMADHGAIAVHTARLLAESTQRAALEERNRVARDIHDAVSQSLFSMRMQATALLITAERTDDPTVPGLQDLTSVVDRTVHDMRALIMHLRPPDLHDVGVAEAIERFTMAICDRAACRVEFHAAGDLPRLSSTTEMEIYLIAREAIGNAANHAQASRITVDLGPIWRDGGRLLRLNVCDDGIGFDPELDRPDRLGVASMRSRAAELGGRLSITSTGAGTTIDLEVPAPMTRTERP